MLYMNESDMHDARARARTPEMIRACQFLIAFKLEVDSHSDGWAYWKAPLRAAQRLIDAIKSGQMTDAKFRWALAPIKSFYARKGNAAGMEYPTV